MVSMMRLRVALSLCALLASVGATYVSASAWRDSRDVASPPHDSTIAAPDLTVTALTAPPTGTIGGQISFSTTVLNQGSAAAIGYTLGLYLSTDQAITVADRLIATCVMATLTPGATESCNASVTIPADVLPGTYYIGALADSLGLVIEVDETNNARSQQISIVPLTYPLSVSVTGSGTVTSSPGAISCSSTGATCAGNFTNGTSVQLTPTPSSGWSFSGWSGACIGTGPCIVSMTGARSVTATFTQTMNPLAVSILGGTGSVTSTPSGIACGLIAGACTFNYASGTSVQLTATPGFGWTFSGWSGACAGMGPCAVTLLGPKTVVATFSPTTYPLSVSVSGNGLVTSSPSGIICSGGTCGVDYPIGTTVHLTASPSSGWVFLGWGGSCSGTNTCGVTMLGASNVSATFALAPPGSFNKIAPESSPIQNPTSMTFSWEAGAGASSFEWCVDTLDNDVCDDQWRPTSLNAATLSLANGATYYWQVRAMNAGGTTEADAGIWWSFRTYAAGTYFSDDMEAGSGKWTGQPPWVVTTQSAHSGAHAWSNNPSGTDGAGIDASLVSRAIDLSGASSPILSFWHRRTLAGIGDAVKVWISTDGWQTHTLLSGFVGSDPSWFQTTIDLSAYAGQATVQLAFQIVSGLTGAGDDWDVDDVVVHEAPVSPAPGAFGKANPPNDSIQGVALTLTWTPSAGAAGYEYCLATAASCTGGWLPAGTNTSVQVPGLTPGAVMYWQVRANAPGGMTYADGSPASFWNFAVKPAVASDFTADQKSDVLWRHNTRGEVWLWPMNGAAKLSENFAGLVADTNWEIRGTGDQNGDGRADILGVTSSPASLSTGP
jgi:hypothetical protein